MRSFVVEADGGSRGNPGPAAYGALVRDADTGDLLAEVAEYIGIASNNVAEYRGLIAALTAAHALDASARVEARMDSKLVVEQMSGRWQIKHPSMRPLALQARGIFPPGQVRYVWIPRERNKDADRLANEALDAAAAGRGWRSGPLTGAAREPETEDSGAANELRFAADATGVRPLGMRVGQPTPSLLPEDPAAALVPVAGTSVTSSVDEAEIEPTPNALVGWADLGPPTKFVLLRHGETEHTVERVFSGRGGDDPPLTDTGREQAAQAAAALVARRQGTAWHGMTALHAVVCSPLRRSRETAEIVAAALDLPIEVEPDFAECAFGEWEGHTLAEVVQAWPDELASWSRSSAVAPPGGESYDAVALRVRRARDRLLADRPRHTLLVVSHVTPIKELVRLTLGAPASAMYRMELQPAAFTVVDWYTDGNASLRAFNEVSHLSPAA